jgi:hypothetical protein
MSEPDPLFRTRNNGSGSDLVLSFPAAATCLIWSLNIRPSCAIRKRFGPFDLISAAYNIKA